MTLTARVYALRDQHDKPTTAQLRAEFLRLVLQDVRDGFIPVDRAVTLIDQVWPS